MDYPYKFAALVLDGHSTCESKSDIGLRLNASQPFTIDAWIRTADIHTTKSILRQDNLIDFGIDRDSLYLGIYGFPQIMSTPQQGMVEKDIWTHICAVYDGSSITLFINGISNVYAAVNGRGNTSSAPFVFGHDFNGTIKQVRIFNTALDSDAVREYMLHSDISDKAFFNTLAAYYDFTVVPAKEHIKKNAITMKKAARQDGFSFGAWFRGNSFMEIDNDPFINPAGRGNDSYTVQSWVYLEPTDFEISYVIFANGNVFNDSGMTLLIQKDGNAFRAVSLRASDSGKDDVLVSKRTIPARQWVNIATTYSVDTLKIYVDGVLDNSLSGLFPIALTLNSTVPRIGSEVISNNENGKFWFTGYISNFSIWNIALNNSDIQKFAAESPQADEQGLLANYNFHLGDGVNSCTIMPIGKRNSVAYNELQYRFPKNMKIDRVPVNKQQIEPLSAELLERFRHEAMSDERKDFFRKYHEENKLTLNIPQDFFFTVTSHKIDGNIYFVAHEKKESYTMCFGSEADIGFSEELLWWIELILILVGGLLSLLFAIKVIGTPTLFARLSRIVESVIQGNPSIATLLSNVFSWEQIPRLLGIIATTGALKEILLTVLSSQTWITISICVAKVLFLVGASALGASWVYYLAALTLLAGEIAYHITKKLFAPSKVGVASIAFHTLGDNTGNGMTVQLSKDNKNFVNPPEWISNSTQSQSSPVAFCVKKCNGNIVIHASFQSDDKSNFSVKVKCSDISESKLLGESDEVIVKMANRVSSPSYVNFTFKAHKLGSAAVGKTVAKLKWSYYKEVEFKWVEIITTQHTIYTLLDMPNAPWSNNIAPWVEVLDYACVWANGQKTQEGVAKAITQTVNGNLKLEYDIKRGAPYYTSSTQFKLTAFLEFLRGEIGSNVVNCADCATITSTFANALGCKLSQKQMRDTKNGNGIGFTCNEIIAIGYKVWKVPFAYGFSFHEVCMFEPLDTSVSDVKPQENNYHIYDACLHVNGTTNPADKDKHPLLPCGMKFSTFSDSSAFPRRSIPAKESYREHLATNDYEGAGSCLYDYKNNDNSNLTFKDVR